ncbi:MAG: hypothetical protein IKT87_06370 [Bacteroidaceae bacterium]|nr:hypothetical protein [Bacteroidaceae bacterium]
MFCERFFDFSLIAPRSNVITDKAINWMENRDKERPLILFVPAKMIALFAGLLKKA